MKNKILIALVVVLLVINIALAIALGKVKKAVKELDQRVDKITETNETQNRIINNLQTEVTHLRIQQQDKENVIEKKGK